MRLLMISHSAEPTGAPISALQLGRAFKHHGTDLRIILRRPGTLTEKFEAVAPTFVWRPTSNFGLKDVYRTSHQYDPIMAAKCWRNPERPYCLSANEQILAQEIVNTIAEWAPSAIYANTTHCGDILDLLNTNIPVFTHVRELGPSIADLDPRRRHSALTKTNYFFCASKGVSNDLHNQFQIAHDRLGVEPPAINIEDEDISSADKHSSDIAKRYDIKNDTRLIVGAGTLTPRKGPALFLDAAIHALKTYMGPGHLKFVWLGDGELRHSLIKRAESEGVSKQVLFPGAISDPLFVFRRAATLLVTSTEDPYPRVAIEAAAMGASVIAFSGGGGATDLIRDYNAGDVIDGFDSIQMGERACVLAANWTQPDANLSSRIIAARSAEKSAARILKKIEDLL